MVYDPWGKSWRDTLKKETKSQMSELQVNASQTWRFTQVKGQASR